MRRISNRLVLGGAWMLLAAAPGNATRDEVSASKGWVQLPSDGETSASAFVVVKNPTMYDIYLVSATTAVAGKVEFRDARDGEAKSVREVTVPAYGSMSMTADGVHLSLVDLERPLETGETIPLTITTDASAKLRVQAVVRERTP